MGIATKINRRLFSQSDDGTRRTELGEKEREEGRGGAVDARFYCEFGE